VQGEFPDLFASFFISQCNHCDSPAYVDPCPTGATYQLQNGIVKVDPEVCIGCGYCVEACPYDARYINPVTKKVDKCDFCESRLAEGLQPACVVTCTANAKFFGDLEDRNSIVYQKVFREGARRMENENAAIGPNVYYLGSEKQLELVRKKFGPRKPIFATPAMIWAKLLKPFIFFAVGATFAGQAIAFFHQLIKGEEEYDD